MRLSGTQYQNKLKAPRPPSVVPSSRSHSSGGGLVDANGNVRGMLTQGRALPKPPELTGSSAHTQPMPMGPYGNTLAQLDKIQARTGTDPGTQAMVRAVQTQQLRTAAAQRLAAQQAQQAQQASTSHGAVMPQPAMPGMGGPASTALPSVGGASGGIAGTGLPDYVTQIPTYEELQKLASANVGSQLNPQIAALDRQLQLAQTQYGQQQQKAQLFHNQQQSDLDYIYQHLGNFIQAQQQGMDKQYGQVGQQMGDAYSALQGSIDKNGQQAQDSVANELSRLGVQQAAQSPLSLLAGDQSFVKGLADASATNHQSALNSQHSAFDALSSLLAGDAQASGAMAKNQSNLAFNNQAIDALNALHNQQFDLTGQKNALDATRGNLTTQQLAALVDRYRTQAIEDYQRNFQNQIAEQGLGINMAKLQQSQAMQALDAQLKQAQAAEAAARGGYYQSKTGPGGTTTKKPSGYSDAVNYLQQKGGANATALKNILDVAMGGNGGKYVFNNQNLGTVMNAVNQSLQSRGLQNMSPDMQNAILIALGKF